MRCPIIGGAVYTPVADGALYNTLHGHAGTWLASSWYQVVPCAGKFSKLLVTNRVFAPEGISFTLNLYKNGAATALSATMVYPNNKAEDTINEVAAVDGDLVCVQLVPSGWVGTEPKYMMLFTPDDPTKGIILGNTEGWASGELDNTGTVYASIACGGVRLNATASIWPQPMPTPGKFTYARVTLTGAPDPGGSDGYTFTLQKNGIDTGIVITISGDDTTGAATADVPFAADDYFNWKISPSGTPSATPSAAWGLVYQPDTSGEAIILGQTYSNMHQTNINQNVMTHWAITPWVTFNDAQRGYENNLWKMTIKKLHILLETAPGVGWTLQEHYDAAYDNAIAIFAANWEAQTFTPSATHNCKKVALHIARVGDLTGVSLTVAIRNTDGSGHPTVGDLASKTVDASPISTTFGWVEFELDSSVSLSNGTKYAIVWRLDGGDGTHRIDARCQSGDPYAGGNVERSNNSGGSWTPLAAYDYNFREYELGADKSYTFTLYKRTWDIVGANTPLSVAISGTNTAGGDDVNEVSAVDYDGIRMGCVPSGTPDLSRAKWGIVMDVPPLVGGKGSIKQQMVKKLLV